MVDIKERYVEPIRRFAAQFVAVASEVPIPRTSRPKSSPCCQGTLPYIVISISYSKHKSTISPKPIAYDATNMIIESKTIADHVVEYDMPSMRVPPVLLVRTGRIVL